MAPGDKVRITEPWAQAFPDVYTIASIEGQTAVLGGIPEGFANTFDLTFLVLA